MRERYYATVKTVVEVIGIVVRQGARPMWVEPVRQHPVRRELAASSCYGILHQMVLELAKRRRNSQLESLYGNRDNSFPVGAPKGFSSWDKKL